jgi:hypothetical protein
MGGVKVGNNNIGGRGCQLLAQAGWENLLRELTLSSAGVMQIAATLESKAASRLPKSAGPSSRLSILVHHMQQRMEQH